MRFTMSRPRTTTLLLLATLTGCSGDRASPGLDTDSVAAARRESAESPAPLNMVSLVDTTIAPAIAGVNGWNYHQEATADLTGDGTPERVVLTAYVELYRGKPLWDDGQAWQVYVEFADSTRSYAYARRLQLGTLEMRLSRAESGRLPTIVLLEHLPDRLRVAEATVDSARGVTTHVLFERNLDPTGDLASRMR